MNTEKKFHWFWPWNDEKEEAWLREMSGQGLHFKTVESPGFYIFERGIPIDYVYRLDYFTGRDDTANYQQLFEDAGWDYLGDTLGGWQYFRQEAVQSEHQEIYTDNASKVKKYQRMMTFLIILLPIIISGLTVGVGIGGIPELMVFLTVVIVLFFAFALVRLLQRIGQLRAVA